MNAPPLPSSFLHITISRTQLRNEPYHSLICDEVEWKNSVCEISFGPVLSG
ncbi:hypothetical protein JOB18_013096 [Solea senegalensis]|uniref:Uncharacterized protein n=1 Tax=Solea senegalensis TaxID=28829 RepID=A0AAV6S7A0_SOLSE|nr:hypothetical protein JOB18_013096 [Solea senegalensis]